MIPSSSILTLSFVIHCTVVGNWLGMIVVKIPGLRMRWIPDCVSSMSTVSSQPETFDKKTLVVRSPRSWELFLRGGVQLSGTVLGWSRRHPLNWANVGAVALFTACPADNVIRSDWTGCCGGFNIFKAL
jgi:hypothetical protein